MGAINHLSLRKKLRKLNSKLRFIFGPLEVSGVYLIDPGHPKARSNGLRHVASMPSPRHFNRVPQRDFKTEKFIDAEGNPRIVRGWNALVNTLVAHGVFSRGKAKRAFPDLRMPKQSLAVGWYEGV